FLRCVARNNTDQCSPRRSPKWPVRSIAGGARNKKECIRDENLSIFRRRSKRIERSNVFNRETADAARPVDTCLVRGPAFEPGVGKLGFSRFGSNTPHHAQ